jgi:hypothetical protein
VLLSLESSAAVTASLAAAGAIIAFVTLRDDSTKPYVSHPWAMSQVQALERTWQSTVGATLDAYERDVPPHACVGAIVGGDEPSYVLWGPKLEHRVYYLPAIGALPQAYRDGVFHVVVSVAADAPSADEFKAVGWRIQQLGSYWLLATAPHARVDGCA